MISGLTIPRLDRRGLRAALLALLVAPWMCMPAWAFGIDDLMGLLGRAKHGEARFTEQRFVKGLDGPLDATGVLHFTPPDRLERRTLTPRAESMRVDGNVIVLSRGGRTRTVTLDSMPELLGMVEALRGTLSGNAPQLQRYFRPQLSGDAAAWSLQLEPLDKALAAQLVRLRISGAQGEVRGVEMEFVGGDRSVMKIEPVKVP
ncbi:MAG: outer membrane lipoprotein carrier protein LolA [Comamonadaceae bacterium]|nr:MAG: outer membrane lipoprotein carrier protein LolA [Comamonadaceae bacterium]